MFNRILAWLAVLLGIAHIIFGFVMIKENPLDLIWFTGAGIAMICVGITNLDFHKASYSIISQNVIMTLYLVVMVCVIPEPQVIFGLILFALLGVLSIRNRMRSS